MPTGYMLNWSDNTLKPPFLLPEATVDNHTTSLQLTGKRVVNWGEFLNENMLHLLEHGFSKTAPNNPTIGQLWLDANSGDLKIFTSQSTWNVIVNVPGIGTQTTTTTTPVPTTTTTTTTTTPFPTTSTTTTTTTRAPAAISIDYPTSVVKDAQFIWTIIGGASDVNFYATGSTWNGGRTPGSGTLPTVNGSTYTKNINGINTNYTPITGFIPTPGTYNLAFHFSNGQTVYKTVTVTA